MEVGTAFVSIRPDTSGFRRELKRDVTAASAGTEVKVKAKVDTNALDRALRSIKGIDQRGRDLGRVFEAIKFPAVAGGILAAASALQATTASAYALGAALSPLAGLVGALPGLLGSAGQAAGTMGLAFSGIGDAVKALSDQQKAAATTATSSGKQQEAAAERVRDAQERIREATLSLTNRQRDARRAQEDLTRARVDARARLADLRRELRRGSLDEREATLAVEEAYTDLQRTINDPRTTDLERRRASLTYDQQVAQLEDVKTRRRELAAEVKTATRAGVNGDRQVVDATERVADANRATAEAARELKIAQQDAARVSTESAAQMSAAAVKVQTAFDNLSPAAQRFARFIYGLRVQFDKLRETAAAGFLPDLEAGIRRALSLFPRVNRAVGETASVMGDLAVQAGNLIASGPFQRDFTRIAQANVELLKDFGAAGLDLVRALVDITVAAQPLARWVGELARGWAANARELTSTTRASGDLRDFFIQVRDTTQTVLNITGDLLGILFDLGRAAFPTGSGLLGSLEEGIDKLHRFTSSVEGQEKLKRFFEDMGRQFRTVLSILGPMVAAIGAGFGKLREWGNSLSAFLDENPRLREMLGTFLAITAAVALASKLTGLGGLAGSLASVALQNPVLALVGAALLGIGAGAVYAYAKNEEFRRSVDLAGQAMGKTGREIAPGLRAELVKLGGTFKNNREQLVALRDFIVERLIPAWGKFTAFVATVWIREIRAAITVVGQFVRAWDAVWRLHSMAAEAFGRVKDAVATGINRVLEQFNGFYAKIREFAGKFNIKLPEIALHFGSAPQGGGRGGGGGKRFKAQQGGTVPGAGTGDTVPAMLEPGELVWPNRDRDRRRLLPQLRERLPRYAQGGVVGRIDGLKPFFLAALRRYAEGIGRTLSVTSGFRTNAQQAALYRAKPGLAAPPGRSNHEFGLAADLAPQLGGTSLGNPAAGRFGLRYPMSYEPWHIEPVNARALRGASGGGVLGGLVGMLAETFASTIAKPFQAAVGRVAGGGVQGQLLTGIAGRVASGVTGWFRGKDTTATPALGGTGGPAGVSPAGLSAAEAWIIQRESGGRTTADNPRSTAFGLGQLLLANRQAYGSRLGFNPGTTDYQQQLAMFRLYVKERYGSAEAAQSFWRSHGWYKHGGVVQGYAAGGLLPPEPFVAVGTRTGRMISLNENGQERVIPAGQGAGNQYVLNLQSLTMSPQDAMRVLEQMEHLHS